MSRADRASKGIARARRPASAGVEEQLFEDVYDEHVWRVYGFFGYRLSSREEAEDLTQLTFERALKAWGRYDAAQAGVGTWLLTIAKNLLIDHFRRKQPIPTEDLEQLAGATEDPMEGPGLGVSPELERALAVLSERDRELIALRYGGELNGPEIADLTGLSLANVQQILSRSLRRLRAELEGDAVPAKERAASASSEGAGTEHADGGDHQKRRA